MISIIICSIDPLKFNRIVEHYRTLLASEPAEIIGIHDARSICEAYNRGLAATKGDIVIFSHDDIEIWTSEFVPRLQHHLGLYDAIGVAGATRVVNAHWCAAAAPYTFGQVCRPYKGQFLVSVWGALKRLHGGIQVMDGLFLAFRRDVIQRVAWDAATFDGFHGYDVDCTYRAHLLGYRLAVALDLPMFHMSPGNFSPDWERYNLAFLRKHAATLAPPTARFMGSSSVLTSSKHEATQIMQAQYELLP
jgi:GT2 family glycosyltransferase